MTRWLWSMIIHMTGRQLLAECPMWCLGHPYEQERPQDQTSPEKRHADD